MASRKWLFTMAPRNIVLHYYDYNTAHIISLNALPPVCYFTFKLQLPGFDETLTVLGGQPLHHKISRRYIQDFQRVPTSAGWYLEWIGSLLDIITISSCVYTLVSLLLVAALFFSYHQPSQSPQKVVQHSSGLHFLPT